MTNAKTQTTGSYITNWVSSFKKWSFSTIFSLQSCNNRCYEYPCLHFVSHHTCAECIMLAISGSVFLSFHLVGQILVSAYLAQRASDAVEKPATALEQNSGQILAIRYLQNTENILSSCLYHTSIPNLNKYVFVLGCRHSYCKSDECISSRSLLLQA